MDIRDGRGPDCAENRAVPDTAAVGSPRLGGALGCEHTFPAYLLRQLSEGGR